MLRDCPDGMIPSSGMEWLSGVEGGLLKSVAVILTLQNTGQASGSR